MMDTDDFLAHYGIKGMRWGVRKDDAVLSRITGHKIADENKEDRANYKAYKKNTSRKDRKTDKMKALESRSQFILKNSLQNPKYFVEVGTVGYPTLMRGKEFVDYLSNGGSFNPMTTRITDFYED